MPVRNHQVLRISSEQLKPGMVVVELDRPWVESPFNVHGFKITTRQQLEQLKQCCHYVYIAVKKKTDTEGSKLKRRRYRNTLEFEKALPQAKSTHRQAKSVVKGLFKSLRMGQTFDSAVAKRTVKQCVDGVIANQEAMLWLGLLKNVDEYTAEHSLNVALLSIILGRAEGLEPLELERVGLCGMLHDMGKSEIPLEILNKEGALTEQEFEAMKTHAARGYRILKKKGDIIPEAAEVAHSHHERLNGKGYPRKLGDNDISYFSRIVAIADAYDAITSTRIYSPAKTALEGLKILMGAKGSHFDPRLVESFIEAIGIYPAGSVAELSSGEIAVVLPTPQANNEQPIVLIVRNSDKQPCVERKLDLSQKPLDVEGRPVKIKHLLSNGAFGIDLKNYHERSAG